MFGLKRKEIQPWFGGVGFEKGWGEKSNLSFISGAEGGSKKT